jgi:hypothetical protein
MNPSLETIKLRTMKNNSNENERFLTTDTSGGLFEIYVKGQLDKSWSEWLGGMEIELANEGEMILTGNIGDQAALMGILNKLYSLNLTIVSLRKTNQRK